MSISNNKTNGNYLQNAGIAITTGAWSISCWFVPTSAAAGGEFEGIWFIDNAVNNFTGADVENVGGTSHLVVYNFLTFSADLGAVTLNTPYFLAMTSGGSAAGGSVISYHGTGGTLTKTTLTATGAIALSGGLTIFNEQANDEPFGGAIHAFKCWKAQLTDIEIANEYRQARPVRTANLFCFYPMLNSGQQGVDWSGLGNAATQTGTLPSSSLVAPVTWKTPAYMQ